jgi:predicted site-specific integrase-resolvase
MALIGYARVSTAEQDGTLQTDALRKAGCGRVFEDTASGAKTDRPGLADALAYLRDGERIGISTPPKQVSPCFSRHVKATSNENCVRKPHSSTQTHRLKAEERPNSAGIGFSGTSRPATGLNLRQSLLLSPLLGDAFSVDA